LRIWAIPTSTGAKAVAQSTGIPGIRGTDHIGFTVPDLDVAVDFFVNVIGCEDLYALGPIRADDDWMQTHLNVHPRAVMTRQRFLRCHNGANFEIFEFESPDQRTGLPKNSDIGGHHIAFYVDDFDAARAYLLKKGVTMLGEPTVRVEGPVAGQTWQYFLAPWGMQLELCSYPNGKGYEKHTDQLAWHPGKCKDVR